MLNDELTQQEFEIQNKNSELALLRKRYVDHAENSSLDNVIMIVHKHTNKDADILYKYPYYASRIQIRSLNEKRQWLLKKFSNYEEIVVIANPNSIHAFNRFEEVGHVERFQCHFKLVDLSREDLYVMGVSPPFKE